MSGFNLITVAAMNDVEAFGLAERIFKIFSHSIEGVEVMGVKISRPVYSDTDRALDIARAALEKNASEHISSISQPELGQVPTPGALTAQVALAAMDAVVGAEELGRG